MPFGRATRLVDARLSAFAAERADLLGASPVYTRLRERILAEGVPSRQGHRIELGDGVYAELQGWADRQPIAFGRACVPATRFQLICARDPDPTRPLAHDTCEQYWLSHSEDEDVERIASIVRAASSLRVSVDVGRLLVEMRQSDGTAVQLDLRRIGRKREGAFAAGGEPLDVLRVANTESDVYAVGPRLIDLARVPNGRQGAAPYIKRLTFLSAPAARQMMTLLEQGRLSGGDLDKELLDASLAATAFDPTVTCRVCSRQFRPAWAAYERGASDNQWKLCPECGRKIDNEARIAPKDGDPLKDLAQLAELLGRVPSSQWYDQLEQIQDFDHYIRVRRFGLRMRGAPWYATEYGSWFHALVAAGLLSDGTQRTTVGYRTLAADGHMCASLGEKTIDDWLHRHGIAHTREPAYGEGRYRADWLVNGRFVEYFGLMGLPDYDAKSVIKRAIAAEAGVTLVEITPTDLAAWDSTQYRVAAELGVTIDKTATARRPEFR